MCEFALYEKESYCVSDSFYYSVGGYILAISPSTEFDAHGDVYDRLHMYHLKGI